MLFQPSFAVLLVQEWFPGDSGTKVVSEIHLLDMVARHALESPRSTSMRSI